MKRWFIVTLAGLICLAPLKVKAKIYRWVDKNGIEHLTDNKHKIPVEYQDQVAVSQTLNERRKTSERTIIHFEGKGSTIVVNGVLNHQLPVLFHLDTGATETLITPEDARKLGIDTRYAPRVTTRLADEREVSFPQVRLKSLRVGNVEVREIDVLIGKTRLLGLSFLNEFKVTMDSEHGQLILEEPEKEPEQESAEIIEEKEHLLSKYEAKKKKIRLDIEKVEKKIAFIESEIDSLQKKQYRLEELLSKAYGRDDIDINIEELEAIIQRTQLALDSRHLQIESYKTDIEMLRNNIEYYQNWIYRLK